MTSGTVDRNSKEFLPLQGKVALVTGAAVGIGLAIAKALAGQGADIAAVYRSSGLEDLESELKPLGVRLAGVHADLARRDDVSAIVPEVVEQLGRVDILVNNAAVSGIRTLLDQPDDEWDQILAVNLTAPFILSRDAARQMIIQGDGGRIVNMSSSGAFRAILAPPAYVSSKGGLGALTRSSAGELGKHGILVNAVVPGVTVTPMLRAAWGDVVDGDELASEGPLANLLGRLAQPEDIAEVVKFLCLPASRNITGQMIHASAGAIV